MCRGDSEPVDQPAQESQVDCVQDVEHDLLLPSATSGEEAGFALSSGFDVRDDLDAFRQDLLSEYHSVDEESCCER